MSVESTRRRHLVECALIEDGLRIIHEQAHLRSCWIVFPGRMISYILLDEMVVSDNGSDATRAAAGPAWSSQAESSVVHRDHCLISCGLFAEYEEDSQCTDTTRRGTLRASLLLPCRADT